MPTRFQTTRRSFLKTLGAAGVGAVALPQIVPSHVFGADAPSNKVNVAMFSCGSRSRQLLPYVLRSGGNVVAICDVDTRQVAQMKLEGMRHGAVGASVEKAKVYEDYRKLLDDEKSVEAVVVCPGQRWHVPMSKRALNAGKHVYCEKPLAHSAAQAREIRELGRQTRLATQVGSQGGASNLFRRSMEVIQAGVLGPIREVYVWISSGCGPSREFDTKADPIPAELNWDFWCGPSKVIPFKNHYLGDCEKWGPWLEFGDGYLADMGAHCLNLPWRALKLTAPLSCTFKISEPLKDSYPSSSDLRWEFAAREGMPPVTLWWHDGGKGGPPENWARNCFPRTTKCRAKACCLPVRRGFCSQTLRARAPWSNSRATPSAAACKTTRPAGRCPSRSRGPRARTTWANGWAPAAAVPKPSRASTRLRWWPRSRWSA